MIIDVDSPPEIECLVAILSLGLCTALENKSMTILEAQGYLFSPYTMSLLQRVKASADLVKLVHLGTELEDFESILPSRLPSRLNTMKTLAFSILQSLPELLEDEYKEHWLLPQNSFSLRRDTGNNSSHIRADIVEEHKDLSLSLRAGSLAASETTDRNEKLYRMLLIAYDDNGSAFWSFVQELFSINHWNDTVSDDEADAAYLAAIPETQELVRELLRRGLVYITRTHGFPPPSIGTLVVTEAEIEDIIADQQNWIGPLGEGNSAIYYSLCSTIPGASITRDSVLLPEVNLP